MKVIFQILLLNIIFLSFGITNTFSQAPVKSKEGYRLPYIIEGEDTIPVVNLNTVNIQETGNPAYLKDAQAYYRLRFNVIKVYPYARLAAVKLNEMNQKMTMLPNDRERRRYKKTVEEQVRKDFEEQIKKLSIKQGDVLIKLIDRETGHTSYELIKQLKGSFNAFFAQGIAKLFGHDLKDDYDAQGEDAGIENIVLQIQRGEITF